MKTLKNTLCSITITLFFTTLTNAQVFTENFDTGIPGTWAVFDNGVGISIDWMTNTNAYLGANAAYVSYDCGVTSTSEDWLVTPLLTPTVGNESLNFYQQGPDPTVYGTIMTVRISTLTQTTPGDFTTIFTQTESALPTSYGIQQVDLTAYIGQPIYVAFVMTQNCGDEWFIDEVEVGSNCITVTGTDTKTECDSLVWIDGNTYTASNNIATHTIISGAASGCDSLVTLDLTINISATGTDTKIECDSLVWIDGNTYTVSNNIATHTIVNGAASGCDSLVTLNLTINSLATGTDTRIECNSLVWIDGNTYTASNNTATHTIINGAASGCDSIVTLDLTINNSVTGIDTRTECDSLVWIDGNTYTTTNNTATWTLTSSTGCDSLITLDLTINSVSDLTASISGITITANNGSASYQWLDCNNNYAIIGGENGQSYSATVNGNYAVELTENGCTDTSSCRQILSVGIGENTFTNSLLVYPNPSDGNFSIQLDKKYPSILVDITDVSGKLIQSRTFNEQQSINVKLDNTAGLYFLTIKAGSSSATIRIVKK